MATKRRSELEAFDGCPFRYDQVWNRGVPDQGDETVRGIAFHAAAFAYILRLANAQTPADHEEAVLAFREGVAQVKVPTHLIPEVHRLFFRWAEGFELDLKAYLAAEERLESRGFQFRPDLVYIRPHEVEIKDWKTYFRGLTQAQADREFQPRFYLTQAIDLWPGFRRYRFTFVFVRLNFEVSVVVDDPAQVDDWRPQVEAILDGIAAAETSGDWPAVPGSHCSLCRLACPIADNPARLPVRFTTKAQAEQAAGQVLVLEQRLKALRKALGGWCQVEGPLVLKGQVFGYAESQAVTYRLGDVAALADRAGFRTAFDNVTLSGGDLAHITKGLRGTSIDRDLRALGHSQPSWKFRHRKAGELDLAPDGQADILGDPDGDEGPDEH